MNWLATFKEKLKAFRPKQEPGDWAAMEALIQNSSPLAAPKNATVTRRLGFLSVVLLIGVAIFFFTSTTVAPTYSPRVDDFKLDSLRSDETSNSAKEVVQQAAFPEMEKGRAIIPTGTVENQQLITAFQSKKDDSSRNLASPEKNSNHTILVNEESKMALPMLSLVITSRPEGIVTHPLQENFFETTTYVNQGFTNRKPVFSLPEYARYSFGITDGNLGGRPLNYTQEAVVGWGQKHWVLEVGIGQTQYDVQHGEANSLQYYNGVGSFEEMHVDSSWQIIQMYQGAWRYDTTHTTFSTLFSDSIAKAGESAISSVQQLHLPIRLGYRRSYKSLRLGITAGVQVTRVERFSIHPETPNPRTAYYFWQPQVVPSFGIQVTKNIEVFTEADLRVSSAVDRPIWWRAGVSFLW